MWTQIYWGQERPRGAQRELKRSHDGDFESLLADFSDEDDDYEKPEHAAWAEEFEAADED